MSNEISKEEEKQEPALPLADPLLGPLKEIYNFWNKFEANEPFPGSPREKEPDEDEI